ncbi:capsid protein [Listeria monocytogenes]|uniref:capsid protein n=1 Tax=Listeria innocua TaxID=1642 RepID=UPI000F23FC68|nr:capsid protein [Listeria innocua]EAC6756258.1 capsid protein [Listeria monocytogenes]EHC5234899.1 capsid protein [Listeria monocytogenes serotype 1/2a]EAE1800014.1 capsid protein [Listeria monocytogenes]EAE7073748.1 capsid protein [Listeria monocytogenes]EAF5021725.1 capsid protein [Listeria monocytogenes]
MPVILDAKDLEKLDKEFAVESKVWAVLGQGGQELKESDFVGVKEVRVNKMTGFKASDYNRNGDNARNKIDVAKETRKLEKERWMGYDLDALDQSENGSYDIANVVEEHNRLVSIPEKDKTAVERLLEMAGKLVKETITTASSLTAYDAAEQYMLDAEIAGPFVMFASSDYYQSLKNNDKVAKTFSVNEVNINGINRKVGQLDGDVPIINVPKSRLQVDTAKVINFILVPLRVAMPVEKYNDVTIIPASQDRDGYRDTVKGLNYYDLLVFDNAKEAIYISYKDAPSGN